MSKSEKLRRTANAIRQNIQHYYEVVALAWATVDVHRLDDWIFENGVVLTKLAAEQQHAALVVCAVCTALEATRALGRFADTLSLADKYLREKAAAAATEAAPAAADEQ